MLLWSCNTGLGPANFTNGFKPAENPVLKADSAFTFYCPVKKEAIKWQRADVFNPAAIVRNDTLFLLYRCEDNPKAILGGRTSRIGLASSTDGLHFTKYPKPVLYPDVDDFSIYDQPGGCEDPRIVKTPEGKYIMAYTSWNLKTARLSMAESDDLIHWVKKGPAFEDAYHGRFHNTWSKSGSIITEMKNGVQTAIKIQDKYWMYWGEDFVNLAWSTNLYDWVPTLNESGELMVLIRTRKNKFDSRLTECGPPALLTKDGIVLLYNGKNAEDENADPSLPKNTYTVGRVIFDAKDPTRVISRSDTYLIKPTLPHEITGQYAAGTVFGEGLVYYKSKWWLYYGTADSFVGVAVLK
ncbi:MAG: hypothetical protein IPN29_14590 [Saprospiraceae bacterium]|nr:hypothetical protein [Saprospiraceae bacterium]